MEAKDSLCKVLKALLEINQEISISCTIDYIQGRDNSYITETGLDELETFGLGENTEDTLWESVIEKAISAGYITANKTDQGTLIQPSSAGKKYLKKPTSFVISDEDEIQESNLVVDDIDFVSAERPVKPVVTKRSSGKIELIHAIDNKKDLDDFAESQGKDFLEVLDDLESIIQSGMKIDINYFIDEVLDEDQVDEILDMLDATGGDVQSVIDQLDYSYSEDEIRLVNIKYLADLQN